MMQFKASFEVGSFVPKWTGNVWMYKGRKFRSLRLLRHCKAFKLEEQLTRAMSNEITAEIDREIIDMLTVANRWRSRVA